VEPSPFREESTSMRCRGFAIILLALAPGAAGHPPAGARRPDHELSPATCTPSGCGATQRYDGSLYNFTTMPGEGYGDRARARSSSCCSPPSRRGHSRSPGRVQSRFNQNQWTNFGGFGGSNPAFEDPPGGALRRRRLRRVRPALEQRVRQAAGADRPHHAGLQVVDAVTIGSTDLGMFDPFTIGKIRYIDRDNASAVLFQGCVRGSQARLRPDPRLAAAAMGRAPTSTPATSPAKTASTACSSASTRARCSTAPSWLRARARSRGRQQRHRLRRRPRRGHPLRATTSTA
jgi:hypothetical protein